MDLAEIKKILELMEKNELVEFEYEEEGKKVRLRRSEGRGEMPLPLTLTAAAPVGPASPRTPPPEGGESQRADNVVEFKSPLVGTFYRAPRPDADPFVNVGDEVGPEKVLCIIEAMKMMNEIKAEMNGIVREILVKNGQAVEFGEPLFLLEKK